MRTTNHYYKNIKIKDNDIKDFVPDSGIDIIWKKYHDDQYATVIGRNRNEVNAQLNKLKVIQDTIKSYKTYNQTVPPRPLKIEW